MKKYLLIFVLVLLITSVACSVSVDVPQMKTIDTQQFGVFEAAPENQESGNLTIEMGGGTLNLSPGGDAWVSGTIDYNVPLWTPQISRFGKELRIYQETKGNINIPKESIKNDWTFTLGNFPTALTVKAGAYQGKLQLGGVPLTSLEVGDGASQVDVVFDQPNPVVMKQLTYKTGASQIDLEGLGYANAEQISFDGGAGSYTFDFSGELQRDVTVNITYGLGDVKVIIPKGVPAFVTVEGGLNNVELFGTWNIQGNDYELTGDGAKITILVKMGLGNLQLISR